MQWTAHSTSRAHSQTFSICLSHLKKNRGKENPQKTTPEFKGMISNSQWDQYCLWKKTYEVTQRSGTEHTVIPQPWPCSHRVVLLWVGAQTPPKSGSVASTAGVDPCPCSATLFHPRVCQWGLKQKLFCPGCSWQSSCYRLQQLSAVRAALH